MIFSIIIPTYNRVDKLIKCLEHISNQTLPSDKYEIIIVDDCSTDNTKIFCTEFAKDHPNVRYIRNEYNKGRCVTRNEGIRVAVGYYLIFLDNDLLTESDFIQSQLEYFEQNKDRKIAIINDTTYPPEILAKSNFGRFIQSRAIGYRSKSNMSDIRMDNIPANFFAGGGSSIKKKDAIDIGMFEENLKKYGSEDELFGHRFIKSGGKIVFCNKTKIIHNDNDVVPWFWKVKFMELGKFGLSTLLEEEPDYVANTLFTLLTPVEKKDSFSKKIKKMLIKIASNGIFKVPVEFFVFKTDSHKLFYSPILYRYLTMAWIENGFTSEAVNNEVEYK